MRQHLPVGIRIVPWVLAAVAAAPAARAELTVVAVEPAPHALAAPRTTSITVHFDRAVLPGSVVPQRSFWAFGRWSGTVQGTFSFADGDSTVTLTPDEPFFAGESVTVFLSHDLQAADGSSLRSAGHTHRFWVAAAPGPLDLVEVQRLPTRTTPSAQTRSYGGIASDLDGDRFADLTIVNEVSADLRVFLNRGDGSGGFDDFLLPAFPVGSIASPSEPADFDRDGAVDIAVANVGAASVSVLLGNGDGTFAPQQVVAVGAAPRGIAVLDVDGDGDVDIVNTNAGSGNLSLLRNDGSGVFGAATFFDAGGPGEWALAAADMNDDGITDLVVGARDDDQVYVDLGNGDGTFSHATTVPAGGGPWMLVTGDVNGDGREDVVTANHDTNTGAVLFGAGTGGLELPRLVPTDPFPLATDLGDVDGDGALDWILSSFNGDWWLYTNDGNGQFAFAREILAPLAASCALVVDVDDDGDSDLALVDELKDEVLIVSNGAPAGCDPASYSPDADGDGSGGAGATVTACVQPEGWAPAGTDCDDGDADVWALPGECRALGFVPGDTKTLSWIPPAEPGAQSVRYDLLRSALAGDFVGGAVCVESDDTDTSAVDETSPAPGFPLFYLVRAENDCPAGQGSLGRDSVGGERAGRSCP